MPPETIVAIASAPGRAAVGIIRLSGSDVPRIAIDILGALPKARFATLSRFLDGDQTSLDEGLALYFPAPTSLTGEHVLELQGHGGPLVMDLLLRRLLILGCRLARPGEFSERAFLNGKMDVAQAEAVADLINAGSTAAVRAAVRSMQGEFSVRVHKLQLQLTQLRTYVEAVIDFSDEEIGSITNADFSDRLSSIFSTFSSIIAAARQGALLRDGLKVVIAGEPNAGKSSLLNRLVEDDVAIVTDQPGTTRDVLRQHLNIDGLPISLIDTAGLRSPSDAAEAEGIRRARSEIQAADRVLLVVDSSASLKMLASCVPAIESLAVDVPVTVVMNKIDLSGEKPRIEDGKVVRVFVSARTGAGVDLLREHLKLSAGYRDLELGAMSARRRHLDALNRAHSIVMNAAGLLHTAAVELFAEELRQAQRALGEITGEFTSDALLGEIFGSFCIGK